MADLLIALDLSLSSTGIAWTTDDAVEVTTIKPPTKTRGGERLSVIMDRLARRGLFDAGLVIVEELPTYSGHGNTSTKLAELHGVIKYELHQRGCPPPVMVPTQLLKIAATGLGNVKKTPCVVAARDRLGYQGYDEDEVDALWLLQLAAHHVGHPAAVKLPVSHLRALDKVVWNP